MMPESRAHAATRKRQGVGLPTLLREYNLLPQTIRAFSPPAPRRAWNPPRLIRC
jgi:hypothetical protein